MRVAAKPTIQPGDPGHAAWRGTLPDGVRDGPLASDQTARLLDRALRFMRTSSPDDLAELEEETYRLACGLESQVGPEAAMRYLRDGLSRALAIDLKELPPHPSGDGNLVRVVNRLSDAVWKAHVDRLQATIEQQRHDQLAKELQVAKRIQERLLPRTVPEIPGFDIAGRVLPAAEVGGDYWSCKNYPEDDIVTFKLADITGHGIAAATLVSAVKFISGGYYRGSKTAAQVMERTNHVLVQETPHEIMVTMLYGWLYPHSREVSLVNAGHSPVLHFHGGRFCEIAPTGLALGVMETRYRETRLGLEPGDILFACSDGVTDPAPDIALGEAWVRDQVRAGADLNAEALVDRVIEEALQVYGTPRDDMSVIVVKCID